jgi:hypothetical protein
MSEESEKVRSVSTTRIMEIIPAIDGRGAVISNGKTQNIEIDKDAPH